ncbi:zinc transporter 7-like [Gossypium australe]|uniref:Zinc transporter 7-like n=1 Tax=Gossypium australe TaxID=47621 RepID=A0A5B6UKD3_9ROSI|nr:zinc transporter 7-like [Gossypium australe]
MASSPKSLANPTFVIVFMVIFLCYTPLVLAQCEAESKNGCHDKEEAMKLKIIAFVAILLASMIGVSLPLFSRRMPSLGPDRDLFTIVKAFASGVILATGYMHVLPDSFDDLMSDCLPENPWKKFPFTTFVAMLSAIVTLMVDSFAMSVYRKHHAKALMAGDTDVARLENGDVQIENHGHEHHGVMDEKSQLLLRHRVIAQVLELGIIVHSVVIGLAMGASENPCTIRSLIAALCFHQMFEGMGLGGCILQAEYKFKLKAIMVLFFSATTPLGIVLGIGLSKVYSETSPTSLIVVGLLNASSAGLLNYMALVDLLAADFLGPKLQTNMKLQIWSYVAVLLGAGFMSLMAKWA